MAQYQQHQQQQEAVYQPPHYQQDNHIPQQPNAAYQSPQTMNEKMAPVPTPSHEHTHDAQKGGFGTKWTFGLFDCFSPLPTCCLAFWCPCYLFGKTYERNKSGEKDPSGFNGMCCAWYGLALCGFNSCFQCVNRGSIRDKYRIDGNMAEDYLLSCCCNCCTLVQEEKESIVRQTGLDPETGMVYQPVSQMAYN